MSARRRATEGPTLVERARVFEVDEAAPVLRALAGEIMVEETFLSTETPPWLPPTAYPFLITWWPLALLGRDEILSCHDGSRLPLHIVTVDRPGPVKVPTARSWSGSVCICVVYADGTTEWVGP